MAGSKRNRIRKALSPNSTHTPSPPPGNMNDDELLADLVAQLDTQNETVQHEAATVIQSVEKKSNEQAKLKKDGRSRFEARKARKAAEKAAQYMDDEDTEGDAQIQAEARAEEAAIKKICDELSLVMHEVNPDGHCLFAAIADQLRILGILSDSQATYATTREAASMYIFNHVNDFLPFLPSDEGEDGNGATDPGMMTPAHFERYCASIRDTAIWGGEPEILALSKAYNVPVHVVQHGVPSIVVHDPFEGTTSKPAESKRVVRISYHRRMYGLGEHYNSLRPKTLTQQLSALFP